MKTMIYHVEYINQLALIMGTLALNLVDSCDNTSASRFWCLSSFRIFIILTMAACNIER